MTSKLKLKKDIIETCLSIKIQTLAALKENQRPQFESVVENDANQYDMTESPREEYKDTLYQGISIESPLYHQLKGHYREETFDKHHTVLDIF